MAGIPVSERDISGQRFSRLLVIRCTGKRYRNRLLWECLCDCGNTAFINRSALMDGHTRSCGCLNRERVIESHTTHGKSGSLEYKTWHSMHLRCNDPRSNVYHRYGGRGIKICERWGSLENFLEDMGPRPSRDHSIERIDNDGDYEPRNCRWATRSEQGNNRQTSRLITFRNETKTLHQWSQEMGVRRDTISTRLERGWDVERALTTPASTKFNRKKV